MCVLYDVNLIPGRPKCYIFSRKRSTFVSSSSFFFLLPLAPAPPSSCPLLDETYFKNVFPKETPSRIPARMKYATVYYIPPRCIVKRRSVLIVRHQLHFRCLHRDSLNEYNENLITQLLLRTLASACFFRKFSPPWKLFFATELILYTQVCLTPPNLRPFDKLRLLGDKHLPRASMANVTGAHG